MRWKKVHPPGLKTLNAPGASPRRCGALIAITGYLRLDVQVIRRNLMRLGPSRGAGLALEGANDC